MEEASPSLPVDATPAAEAPASPSSRPLTPHEELQLQQLLQLRFWHEKLSASADATPPSATPADPSADLPARWELTRGLTLHAWQRECVDRWFEADRRGVLKVVTGAGKTVLAMAIAERLQQGDCPGLRVAVIVPTVVLLSQWLDELREKSNLPPTAIGVIGGGRNDAFSDEVRVLVCVLNSAARKLAAEVERAGVGDRLLLVVDECHRAGAAEMRHIFKTRRAFSLGLSATPERDDAAASDPEGEEAPSDEDAAPLAFEDSVVGQALGPVIFELSYADAIRRDILPPFKIVHYGLSLTPRERERYDRISREIKDIRSELERGTRRGLALIRWCRSSAGAGNPRAQRLLSLTGERKRTLFRMEQRGEAVSKLLHDLFERQPDGKAILFHESIDEVMSIFSRLQQAGLPVVAEHSQFSEAVRAESLRLFRNGTARIIVSARSLIEGFNVPSADVGIVVAASSSVRQRVQTLGRLLRRSRRSDGTEKEATLYVLYAAGTVDELIYEKVDWEHFTGAKVNEYFTWAAVGSSVPEHHPDPPRVPTPSEAEVDTTALQPGDVYPGDSDQGRLYTIDSQGTIRDEDARLLLPHPQLQAILAAHCHKAGRFRVTPANRLVIKLEKTAEGWRSVFLGRLDTVPEVVATGSDAGEPDRSYSPGDSYPLARVNGTTFSILQRDKRLIAEKTRGEVRFVVPAEELPEAAKAAALRALQLRLTAAYSRGHRINKITVTPEGHVVYVFNNQAFFVGMAPEGAAGFRFQDAFKA